jgi:hypothetical protein
MLRSSFCEPTAKPIAAIEDILDSILSVVVSVVSNSASGVVMFSLPLELCPRLRAYKHCTTTINKAVRLVKLTPLPRFAIVLSWLKPNIRVDAIIPADGRHRLFSPAIAETA